MTFGLTKYNIWYQNFQASKLHLQINGLRCVLVSGSENDIT